QHHEGGRGSRHVPAELPAEDARARHHRRGRRQVATISTRRPSRRAQEEAMRFVARLSNLVRGVLARWLGEREHSHPGAHYEAAIQERVQQYASLRAAAAGVIYMRQKLERELHART